MVIIFKIILCVKIFLKYLLSITIGRLLNKVFPSKGPIVLCYHGHNEEGYWKNKKITKDEVLEELFNISKIMFEQELDFLQNKGYKIISTNDYLNANKIDADNVNCVLITFDDVSHSALPLFDILIERNLPFTVFISPLLIESMPNKYVSVEELIYYQKTNLMTIGNHSYSHNSFKGLSVEEVDDELEKAESFIKNMLTTKSCGFAFPFGLYDKWQLNYIRKKGYDLIFQTDANLSDYNSYSSYVLWRTCIHRLTTIELFKTYISGKSRFF